MYIKAELHIEGLVFPILEFFYNYNQPTNWAGRPNGNIEGGFWTIRLENNGNPIFFAWMVNPTMMKNVKVIAYSSSLSKPYTFELYDVFLVSENNVFFHDNGEDMQREIVLSPAQLAINGEMQHQKLWKVTDVGNETEATSVEDNDESPKISNISWIDKETQNQTEETTYGKKIALRVKIANPKGGKTTIKITKEDGSEFEMEKRVLHM